MSLTKMRVDNPRTLVISFISILLYASLSLIYFGIFDHKFYLKNILNCNIIFVIPIPYIILSALFIFLYPILTGEKRRDLVYPIVAMALILPLAYLLTELKIGFITTNPLSGRRNIYGIYAIGFFMVFLSLFSMSAGTIFRKLAERDISGPLSLGNSNIQNLVFHFPILIYFSYIVGRLSANGFLLYTLWFLALFFLALFLQKAVNVIHYMNTMLGRFVKNERLFLIAIFIAAFLIRYFWGTRLLALTGDRFPTASDDGPCYDHFAEILSQGQLLPRKSILGVTGFAYWYFLAAVYKIFGLHNFRMAFIIQSFIGAFVPIATYFIGKKISASRLVPIVSSVFTSLDLNLVFLSVIIGMEAIYIPLVYLALTCAIYFMEAGRLNYKKAFVLGCAFGFAYNARPPELLPYPIILSAIIYIMFRKYKRSKESARVITSLLIGFLLLISVQYVRNYIIYGEKRIMPGAVTASFHTGLSDGSLTDENKQLWKMGFSPFEDFTGSITTLINNPIPVLKLIVVGFVKRLTILYFIPNFGVFDPFCLISPGTGYFLGFPVYVQCYGYLLTVAGIFAALRKKEYPVGLAILITFIVYVSARVAFFFVLNARYRGVLVPTFILFFAYGVAALYKKIKSSYN